METTILKNDSDNDANPNSGSTLLGSGLKSTGTEQTIYGKFNRDVPTDRMQVGMGINKDNRENALRVDQFGNVTIQGGEIYMDSTVSGIIMRVPVFMDGENKTKKIYLE